MVFQRNQTDTSMPLICILLILRDWATKARGFWYVYDSFNIYDIATVISCMYICTRLIQAIWVQCRRRCERRATSVDKTATTSQAHPQRTVCDKPLIQQLAASSIQSWTSPFRMHPLFGRQQVGKRSFRLFFVPIARNQPNNCLEYLIACIHPELNQSRESFHPANNDYNNNDNFPKKKLSHHHVVNVRIYFIQL